ncbi:MAG: hypothetical protein V4564_25670 [Pseudomonadota bacterium]|uniref:hypothetical protein n=1 Tax=Sphingomonas sp. ERG5 TaxID=1381597 RepID=UPI001F489761|nr:hypothetical protein [Sphingomonas sp. ERG5]
MRELVTTISSFDAALSLGAASAIDAPSAASAVCADAGARLKVIESAVLAYQNKRMDFMHSPLCLQIGKNSLHAPDFISFSPEAVGALNI